MIRRVLVAFGAALVVACAPPVVPPVTPPPPVVTSVSHGSYQGGVDGGTSPPFNVGTCDLLHVWVTYQVGSTLAFADSHGNAYARHAAPAVSGGGALVLFDTWAPNAGSGLTFTLSGTGIAASLEWRCSMGTWTGSDPFNGLVGHGSNVVSVSTIATGAVPSAAGDLMVSAASPFNDAALDATPDSGFLISDGASYVSRTSYPLIAATKTSTGAAESVTWSIGSGVPYFNVAIATFRAAQNGAPTITPPATPPVTPPVTPPAVPRPTPPVVPPLVVPPSPVVSTLPLVQAANLVYQGAFRVPASQNDSDPVLSAFAWGGYALTFWPAHQSLLMSNLYASVGEITIPAPVNSGTLTDLNRATFLQPPTDILAGKIRTVGGDVSNGINVAGLFVRGTDLLANVELAYDASASQASSLFVTGQSFAALPAIAAPARINNGLRVGTTSGWLVPIPSEFQSALGGTLLGGDCCLSIVSRTSNGPCASVFKDTDVGTATPIPATPVVCYPENHPTLGTWLGPGTAFYTMSTVMAGAIWPVGTRSLLFFGRIGTAGNTCYGATTSDPINSFPNLPQTDPRVQVPNFAPNIYCYDPSNPNNHGPSAYPYRYLVWAYDANDLIAVKNGQKKYWEVLPYATWTFTLPIPSYSQHLSGVTYDPATGRVFLAQYGGDYSVSPVIQVFTVQLTASSGTPRPGVQR
jgi:hypothetical protein